MTYEIKVEKDEDGKPWLIRAKVGLGEPPHYREEDLRRYVRMFPMAWVSV